ncbi:MAG: molybdenum cofactor biosynthesis protein MoaE, partial [Solirubrobacterales bacterium]
MITSAAIAAAATSSPSRSRCLFSSAIASRPRGQLSLNPPALVALGEASVVVAASAPHRPEAFAGAREIIDRLK